MPDLEQYQNLVWSIVNKILKKMPDNGYRTELENELFQEGFIGLMEASEKFDNSKDVKFTTFAYPYIRGHCLHYIRKETSVNSKIDFYEDNMSEIGYEEEFFVDSIDIIGQIEDRLRKINRRLTSIEKNVLDLRINKQLDYRTIAKMNNCSTKKVYNIIYSYKSMIKDIIKNNF